MSMEKNRIKPTKSGRNLRMSYSRKKEVVEKTETQCQINEYTPTLIKLLNYRITS